MEGDKKEIAGRYLLTDKNKVGFEVASYDTERPLVIDPILVYSTYLGGSSYEQVNSLTVGKDGRVIAVGDTSSLDVLNR